MVSVGEHDEHAGGADGSVDPRLVAAASVAVLGQGDLSLVDADGCL
jgi:hypothetical protein